MIEALRVVAVCGGILAVYVMGYYDGVDDGHRAATLEAWGLLQADPECMCWGKNPAERGERK